MPLQVLHFKLPLYQEMFVLFKNGQSSNFQTQRYRPAGITDPNSLLTGTATCLSFHIAPVLSTKHFPNHFQEIINIAMMCLRKMCKNTSPYVGYDGPALRSGAVCSHVNVAELFQLEITSLKWCQTDLWKSCYICIQLYEHFHFHFLF